MTILYGVVHMVNGGLIAVLLAPVVREVNPAAGLVVGGLGWFVFGCGVLMLVIGLVPAEKP